MRQRFWKSAAVEQLEPRLMLAADAADDLTLALGVRDESAGSSAGGGQITAHDAGSTFRTAFDLGELRSPQLHRGFVGWWDPRDVMRFNVADEAEVEVRLQDLTADIDLYLFDGSGDQIAASERPSDFSESITRTLDGGSYFLAVIPWNGAASTYSLSLDATLIVQPPPDDPPNEPQPPDPPATFPDVPDFGGANEWNLNAINAPEVWAQGYSGEGVTVAVVDSGVDLNHADLIHNLWVNPSEIPDNGVDDDGNGYVDDVQGWDFVGGDNRPDDGNGHGTHVAGTIAAESNGFGATGVAPDATIMPVRVLGNSGSGSVFGVASGIRYAAENGASIINLSLGGGFSASIRSAIAFANQLGSLVVVASGNESAAVPGYPARFSAEMSGVISVGAHSSTGRLAGFSNRVGSSGAVQVDAPGVSVYSTYAGDQFARLSGTSMAAPHVSGLAALALSANTGLSPAQLRQLIVDGSQRSIDGSDAAGGINAAVTVALAVGRNPSSIAAETLQPHSEGQPAGTSTASRQSVRAANSSSSALAISTPPERRAPLALNRAASPQGSSTDPTVTAAEHVFGHHTSSHRMFLADRTTASRQELNEALREMISWEAAIDELLRDEPAGFFGTS